jgi:hypothetical protein
MTGVPDPTSSTWSFTPSGVEILAIAVLSQTPKKRIPTSFAYKQKASQLMTPSQAAKIANGGVKWLRLRPCVKRP